MIKLIHKNIVYYYIERHHYDEAIQLYDGALSELKLMQMAHFAVDAINNQLIKNRYASIVSILDAHFKPELADNPFSKLPQEL